MRLSWLFSAGDFDHQVGQTDLVCNQRSLIGLYVQEYTALCAAATIYAVLVNIRSEAPTTFSTSLYEQLSRLS